MTNQYTMHDVTGVIVAFNAEETIGKAISSLRDQVGHFLVVDDGSSDNTVNIAKECLLDFPHDIVGLPENKGVGFARQTALDHIKTDLLVWLDADDYALSGRTDQMLEIINSGYDMAYDFAELVNGETGEVLFDLTPPYEFASDDFAALQIARNFIPCNTPMEKTALAKSIGFQTDLRGAEDFDHQLRSFFAGARAGFVRNKSYIHLTWPNSVTRNQSVQEASYQEVLRRLDYQKITEIVKSSNLEPVDQYWVLVMYNLRCRYAERTLELAKLGLRLLDNAQSAQQESALSSRTDWRASTFGFLFMQASAAYLKGDLEQAKSALEQALSHEQSADALNNLFVIQKQLLGQGSQALLESALELFPGYFDATENMKGEGDLRFTLFPLRRQASRNIY